MQKAKRVGRRVALSSPGERLAKCLEDWLGSKGDPCVPDARNLEASDDAWDRLKIRVRAQRAIEALASERVQLACVGEGFPPIIELVEQLPFEWPLPVRPIDQAQPAIWRLRPRPTDANATELRVDDPAQFLVTLVEGVVPAWIECLTAPAAPANAAPPDLKTKAKAVLKLLYGDQAFDEQHACNLTERAPTALAGWPKVAEGTRTQYAKEGCSELRAFGLIEATPNTGTWLTPDGKAEAERRFGSTANK
jgi:hypothetical protein